MALKIKMQHHLFSKDFEVPSDVTGFYENIVAILSSLETAAVILQEIQVRKFMYKYN